jgi:hypothetical protein
MLRHPMTFRQPRKECPLVKKYVTCWVWLLFVACSSAGLVRAADDAIDGVGRPAFRRSENRRPQVVLISYEEEYQSAKTLSSFAQQLRDKQGYDCSVLVGKPETGILGLETLATADVLVLYARRHPLPREQMAMIRRYLTAGKPLVALRTSSHAFATLPTPRAKTKPLAGLEEWPEFDHEVLGGNYYSHYGAGPRAEITPVKNASGHPILAGIRMEQWTGANKLYKVSPLAANTTVLLLGTFENHVEPVAWTHTYHGGRVFYTSMGDAEDFHTPQFCTMLVNAVNWAMGRSLSEKP